MLRRYRSPTTSPPSDRGTAMGRVTRLETYALQTRNVALRDDLAGIAAGDASVGWTLLRHRLRSAVRGGAPTVEFRAWRSAPLRALLRLLLNQPTSRQDVADGLVLYRLLSTRRNVLREQDHLLFLEASDALGDETLFLDALQHARTMGVPEQHLSLLRANRATPGSKTWTDSIESLVTDKDVEPIRLAPAGDTLFDRLEAPGHEHPSSARGVLVSVIVPTFRPDARLVTAVRSLCNQTWRDLEIIVVDDGSGHLFDDVLATVESMDHRVRVLRQTENRGAYAARNAGMRSAHGTLLTCHDDDDWAHPRKLELQARHLLSTGLPANLTPHVRATEELVFKRINVNPRLVQPNFSSLMIRRRPVTERCGQWDDVRSSADAEFIERIQATFSVGVPLASEVPMSVSRIRSSSLTHGELLRGYVSPSRMGYRYSYRYWHRHKGAEPARPSGRPFPVPNELVDEPRHFDLVIVADLKSNGDATQCAIAEASNERSSGSRVGLLHVETLECIDRDELAPAAWEELQRGSAFLTSHSPGTAVDLRLHLSDEGIQLQPDIRLGAVSAQAQPRT